MAMLNFASLIQPTTLIAQNLYVTQEFYISPYGLLADTQLSELQFLDTQNLMQPNQSDGDQ